MTDYAPRSLAGHYLHLEVSTGKESFERIYVPLVSVDETVEEAVERWLDDRLKGRKRNVAKARARLKARVLRASLSRPTSWHRAQAIAAGLDWDAGERLVPGQRTSRRRRR